MIKDAQTCPNCGDYGESRGSIINPSEGRVKKHCYDCDVEWTCVYPVGEPHREDIE